MSTDDHTRTFQLAIALAHFSRLSHAHISGGDCWGEAASRAQGLTVIFIAGAEEVEMATLSSCPVDTSDKRTVSMLEFTVIFIKRVEEAETATLSSATLTPETN